MGIYLNVSVYVQVYTRVYKVNDDGHERFGLTMMDCRQIFRTDNAECKHRNSFSIFKSSAIPDIAESSLVHSHMSAERVN